MLQTGRRSFMKTSAAVAAGLSTLGAPSLISAGVGPNERIRAAVVGLRGRGRRHIDCFHDLADQGVELVALCDADERILDARAEEYEKKSGKKVDRIVDMRRIFDRDDIDVVSFATPNHWHALGTIWACQAGKDVYVEKPGSHNIYEGRKMIEAARKYKRIVQHGTQCRSSANIRKGIELLHEGVIGEVYMARGIAFKIRGSIGEIEEKPTPQGLHWDLWLGPAPKKPWAKVRNNAWHNLWDYGNGEIGNQGVHQLDIIRWGMKLDEHPNRVESMGGKFVHNAPAQETPTTQIASFEYAKRNVLVTFEVRNWYTNTVAGMGEEYPFVDKRNVVGVIFLGKKGYMVIPDYSSFHTFLGEKREPGPSAYDPQIPMSDLPHFANFIEAVRSRRESDLHADIREGHYSATLNHLANIAYRTARALKFDPSKERFIGDEEADSYLTRNYRDPFVVPDEV